MAENREDERAVSGEDSLLDGGFTWLRETVPLKETPPAPRAAGAAPGSPAGEPAVSAEEEAALYLFGGPLLSPMFAGAAMSLSSVCVVGNALRLGRARL